jgi:hypothetical protein
VTRLIGYLKLKPIRELVAIILTLDFDPNLFASLYSVIVRVWGALAPVTALLFFCL